MDFNFEFKGFNWFYLSSPWVTVKNNHFRFWNLFNRKCKDARYWGIGILQINTWHFIYIGDMGFRFCKHANA